MKQIKDILIEVQKNNQLIVAWYAFNNQIIKAEVRIQGVRGDRNELQLQALESSFEYLKKMISGSGKLNFYIEEGSLLFISELRSLSENGELLVSMPEKYKLFDRRENRRLDIEAWVKISWKEKTLRKRCLDLASGGFSIVLGQGELTNMILKKGDTVETQLEFVDMKKPVLATVVELVKLTPFKIASCPYGGARVSFSIDNDLIKQKVKSYITVACEMIGELDK